jgi:putative oxidoreductase
MKKPSRIFLEIIIFSLILLWIYTATSKLLSFSHFKVQMAAQTLPGWFSSILVYALPALEIAAASLLLISRTRLAGLYLSFGLMALFTGYVGLVIINFYGRVPCSCGGILRLFGWKEHFVFNLIFLLLTVSGIYIANRERRQRAT